MHAVPVFLNDTRLISRLEQRVLKRKGTMLNKDLGRSKSCLRDKLSINSVNSSLIMYIVLIPLVSIRVSGFN